MTRITIGADPELFGFKDGKPVSVHDILPGSKWSPCKVPRGAVQVDGVAAEFNIEAAATRGIFIRNIKHVSKILSTIAANNGVTLQAVPTVHFDQAYFDSLPTEAKALGCEPDYNAYTKDVNPKPSTSKPMRTASGHIHIGWEGCNRDDPKYIDLCCDMVKELDLVLYDQSYKWDSDNERMELYGKPGAFRFKPYGLEYRVLSNRWLAADGLMAFVFEASKAVAENVLNGNRAYTRFAGDDYEEFLKKNHYPLVEDFYAKAA